ncbi:MAG: hypothetical protein NVSMB64_10440 [Candidatus Velthaea sp.]
MVSATPAAVRPPAVLRRLDAVTLIQGDGPIVISIRMTAKPRASVSESLDRFSARVLAAGTTAGAWQACASSANAFCRYAAANGVRKLRFEKLEIAGELQIRYAYENAPESAIIRSPIDPLPATATLQAIGRAFGASPAPNASAPSADALLAEVSLPAAVMPELETLRVSCVTMPLFATMSGTPVRAAGKALVANGGQTFSASRAIVVGPARRAYRALHMGAVVYAPAACLSPP